MPFFFELLVALVILAGASFALLGSIGMVRLPDFYTRLHAPTKSTTLGVGGTLIGSSLYFSVLQSGISVQEVLIAMFLFITAPVSAYMLCAAALHRKTPSIAPTRVPSSRKPELEE